MMVLTDENREELRMLLDAYTKRRKELGVSAPGTCLYDAESMDRGIRVVADGLGGATWSYISDPSWAGDSQMVLDGGEACTEAEGVAAARKFWYSDAGGGDAEADGYTGDEGEPDDREVGP